MKVECSSKVGGERGDTEQLIAADVREWIKSVPDGAVISPISHDKGNQRDPWPVLVGLYARWEEAR